MCGRFVAAQPPDRVAAYFDADTDVETLGANFNVAPTNDVYGVVADAAGSRDLQVFQWGLLPIWAKDLKVGYKMINARSETLASKAAFKGVFRKHRCIIPMDGFYEWAPGVEGGPLTKAGALMKRPHYIQRRDGEMLAVAGLWSAWRPKDADPDEPWLHTTSVITTSANATMQPLHDRMPVILPRALWDRWLDPTNQRINMLSPLLVPAPDDLLEVHEVSTEVNNVRNKGPHLIEPI